MCISGYQVRQGILEVLHWMHRILPSVARVATREHRVDDVVLRLVTSLGTWGTTPCKTRLYLLRFWERLGILVSHEHTPYNPVSHQVKANGA